MNSFPLMWKKKGSCTQLGATSPLNQLTADLCNCSSLQIPLKGLSIASLSSSSQPEKQTPPTDKLAEVKHGAQAYNRCLDPHWLQGNKGTDSSCDPQPGQLGRRATQLEMATHRTLLAFLKKEVTIIMYCITYFLTCLYHPASYANLC